MAVIRTLSEQAMREVAEVVRRVLGDHLGDIKSTARNRQGLPIYLGKTDGGLTARSGTTLGTGTVTLQNATSGVMSNRTDDSSASVTKTAYNVSTTAVAAASYGLYAKELLTGALVNIEPMSSSASTGTTAIMFRSAIAFPPGGGVNTYVQEWTGSVWQDEGSRQWVYDDQHQLFLLPGEKTLAFEIDSDRWQPMSYGLDRQGVVNESSGIDVGASGTINIRDFSGGTCAGSESSTSVEACNGDANTNGFRKVFDNEKVGVQYKNQKWHIVSVPRILLIGKPTTDLQSGGSGTFNIYYMVAGTYTAWSGASVSARNATGEAFDSDYYYEILYTANSNVPIAIPIQATACP